MVSNIMETGSIIKPPNNKWVFDPACSFHLAWDHDYFQSVELFDDHMRAANGTPLLVQGIGKAGSVPNVRLAPENDCNLFSFTQARAEGDTVNLSTDMNTFHVVAKDGRTMDFIFDGSMWTWFDTPPSSQPPPSPPSVAMVLSPAAQEFLTLHFRYGHLNYGYIYHAIEDGTWTSFKHSLKHIHLASLPPCPICATAKFKNQPISHHGRYTQPAPGILFHMDLKTIAIRSRHGHYHYFVAFVDDNSGMV